MNARKDKDKFASSVFFKVTIFALLFIAALFAGRAIFDATKSQEIDTMDIDPGADGYVYEESESNSEEDGLSPVDYHNSGDKYLPADSFTFKDADAGQLNNGNLVLVDSNHPYIGDTSDFDDFADQGDGTFYVRSYDISVHEEVLHRLKALSGGYKAEYDLAEVYFYNTSDTDTSDLPYCSDILAERASGYTVDIIMRDSSTRELSYIEDYSNQWVLEHCAEYGFVVRYTDEKSDLTGVQGINYHLRYVGKVNAAIMTEEDMCLEEYLQYLKGFDYKDPLTYSLGDYDYELYYVPESEQIPVPKDSEQNKYYISGNNTDGYIVIVVV